MNPDEYTKIFKRSRWRNYRIALKKILMMYLIKLKKTQTVNPDKNYRMTVRRTNTQAAGNLDNAVFKRKNIWRK